MGIRAADMNLDLSGAKLDVTKHMLPNPRRIGKIEIVLRMPQTNLEDKDKQLLQTIGDNCPVMKSLHPDLEVYTQYISVSYTHLDVYKRQVVSGLSDFTALMVLCQMILPPSFNSSLSTEVITACFTFMR